MLEALGNVDYPSLPLLPGELRPRVLAPDRIPIYGLNRTKLCTFAKLNYLKKETVLTFKLHTKTELVERNFFCMPN